MSTVRNYISISVFLGEILVPYDKDISIGIHLECSGHQISETFLTTKQPASYATWCDQQFFLEIPRKENEDFFTKMQLVISCFGQGDPGNILSKKNITSL